MNDEEEKDVEEKMQQMESPREIIDRHKYQNNLIHNMHNPKSADAGLSHALKKKEIKTGVSSAAASSGIPEPLTEAVMDTQPGEELVEEATSEPTVAAGIAHVISNLVLKKWLIIIIAFSGLFLFLLLIVVTFLLKNSDGLNYAANNYYANEEYTKLYQEVESVVSSYQSKYGVTVDKYLIISALTAYQGNEMYVDDTESGAYDYIEVEDEDNEGNAIYKTIDEMTAKIEILAKYQIKTNSSCSYDSSTMRKIASNDDSNTIFNFWTSASSKEKNYDCNGGSGYSLSIDEGKIDDENSGSTFYWNLIDENFLKEYYPQYFEAIGDDDVYEGQAAKTVEYIYLYADALRTLDCNSGSSSGISNLTTINVECQGVTVLPDANGQYAGVYQLEEYVAGVIADEFPPSYMAAFTSDSNAIKENLKAFAIAIRSFTISQTNGCTTSIRNSSANQNFQPTDNALIWEAVNETAGVVLTYNNTIVLAQYDSYKCRGGATTCTYIKIPGSTTHQVTIPSSWTSRAAGGHGRGMSQIGALSLAADGKSYDEIVRYFYDDNVELQQLSGTSSSSSGSSTAYCQRTGPNASGEGTCDGTTIYKSKEVGKEYLSYDGSSSSMTLLSCTADQTEKALKVIYEACGTIPQIGSSRELDASVTAARSATSLHYTGRAFDLDTREGMQSSDTYFYVTYDDTSGNNNSNYYRLYCKITGTTTSSYAKTYTITPLKFSNGSIKTKASVTDEFLDVTSVFNSYGLYGIGPRSCLNQGDYMCSEWWHFQDTSGFSKGVTTFKQALDQFFGSGYSYSGTPVSSYLNEKWNGGSFG